MRFVHTADWQLGMTRHFLDAEAQARYTDARLTAVRAIGTLAQAEKCSFILVCGDVFESNQLSARTVARALDAMRVSPVPIYLLPGNHDPLDAASIYQSEEFRRRRPEQVRVIERPGTLTVGEGVEIVAAPWYSKRPVSDLVGDQLAELSTAPGVVRIVAGHGAVESVTYTGGSPATIRIGPLGAAVEGGLVHYVALGDRHSLTDVGLDGRVWYSGTPEVTDYDEQVPGQVLVVDVDVERCGVRPHQVGTWRFVEQPCHLNGAEDVDALGGWLAGLSDKERTVVKLVPVGTLGLREKVRLDELLDEHRNLLAALQVSQGRSDLAVLPDDGDLGDLGLSGFAATALAEIEQSARSGGPGAATAQDALGLLYRLTRGTR
ncbi:MAG TPA: DNA repair exonuclease [Mycobacteriales bacterium]